jgi:hypothetical protein
MMRGPEIQTGNTCLSECYSAVEKRSEAKISPERVN